MLFLWISIGVLTISIMLLLTMLGCWTYTDAKVRSDKPEIWTLVVLLTPNFIGIVIYLLMGRTKKADELTAKNKFFIPTIFFGILTILSFVSTIVFTVLVATLTI